MSTINYTYNVIVDRFRQFAAGHFQLRRFTHGEISQADLEKEAEWPWLHIKPRAINYSPGTRAFSFEVFISDLPRDKEDKTGYQAESITDCSLIFQDLINEIYLGNMFGTDVVLTRPVNSEPFVEQYTHTLTGVTGIIELNLDYDWSACSIPASWNYNTPTDSPNDGFGALQFIESLTQDGAFVSLVNDEETPGNSYYYGTDESGVKGWYAIVDNIGLTCETLPECATIISILEDIEALQIDVALKANSADLGATAFSNDYNDLDNLPNIPSGTVTSVDLTAGTGISVSGGPITSSGSITVTNSAPDQVVALSAGTGIGVTGTYPNFTITNSAPSSGGTVTSVAALTLGTTGTDLSSTVANGTTTPVITLNVPTASATNRGALSSADWSTFNNKQAALVSGTNIKTINGNSVLGSGNLVVGGTQVGYRGFKYNVGIGEDYPSPPVPLAGQAFYLLDTDGVYQGFRISQTDANGGNNYDYLVRLNGQPLTVVNADDSISTIGVGTVTFVGGANPYYDIAPAGFSGTAVSGVGYIDFNTSNPALVSGTTIKTINGSSVLGSGNLVVSASPSGVAGAIQFSNGSAFSSDAANLFWDDTNNRLGIGTNAPATTLQVGGTITSQAIIPVADSTHNLGTSALRYNVVFGRTLSANTSSLDLIGFNVRLNDFSGVTRAMLNSSNNFLIGTTTDAGYRLDVNGSVRATGSISAAAGVARGIFVSNTLVATANSDVLVGLDVAPTFTTGAFTNVQTESLVVRGGGNVLMRFKNATATATWGQISATANAFNLNSQAGSLSFTSGNTDAMFIFNSTRNVVIQNGGTFTDAGFRLDVVGTARVQSLSASNATSSAILAGFGDTGFANAMYFQNAGIPNRTIFRGFSSSNEVFRIDVSSGAVFGSGTIEGSAQLTVTSTTKGFLPPRMTTTQKNAIASPVAGLVVYDTTLNKLCVRTASAWETITSV